MAKYLIVLTHGTWAGREGRLPLPFFKVSEYMEREDHILRKVLREKIQSAEAGKNEVEFLPVWWNSRNNQKCRKAGGEAVGKELIKYLDTLAGEHPKVYLFSHSHGVEVYAQMMQAYPRLEPVVSGLIAVNSPNILKMRRDFVRGVKQRRTEILGFMLMFFLASLLLIAMLQFFRKTGDWEPLLQFIVAPFLVFFVAIAIDWMMKTILSFYAQEFKSNAHAYIWKCPVLCTNSSADEAWNFLNLAGSFCQSPFYLTHRFVFAAVYVLTILVMLVWVLFQVWSGWGSIASFDDILAIVRSGAEQYFSYFSGAIEATHPGENMFLIVISYSVICFIGLFIYPLSICIILSLIGFLFGYAFSFFYEKFGIGDGPGVNRKDWFNFLTTRSVITLTPVGASQVQFVDTSTGKGDLAHSRPHSDRWAIERMAEWILTGTANINAKRNEKLEVDTTWETLKGFCSAFWRRCHFLLRR